MADVVVAGNSVVLVSGPRNTIIANTTLTPGLLVLPDAGGKAVLANCVTQANAAATGMTLCSAVTGQPVVIATAGAQVTMGAANCVVKGGVYHVSANNGAVAPEADFNTGQWVCQVGRSPNITDIVLELNAYNITHG